MPSVNETLVDSFTTHAVDLARVEASIQSDVFILLRNLERNLVKNLASSDPTGPTRTAFQRRRLQSLLTETQMTIRESYQDIRRITQASVTSMAQVEQTFVIQSLNEALGIDLVTPTLDAASLKTLTTDTLIQGAPSKEWWKRRASTLQDLFMDEMRQGMLQGEPLAQLLQRVRGTRAGGFKDGIMRVSRTSAERLIRSSVQTAANKIRSEVMNEHKDIIKGKLWHSTLDARTSLICQVRDGRVYTLDDEPVGHSYPALGGAGAAHFSCRSAWVPQTKSWAELSNSQAVTVNGRRSSIRKSYERRMGQAGFTDAEIKERIFQARSSMDGLVPRTTTFPTWLRQKDAASPGFGAQVLGPTRWNLWRSGQLSFTDLVDFKGQPLTVAALQQKLAAQTA